MTKNLNPHYGEYTCYGCGTLHTTDNTVAYCAVCYDRTKCSPAPSAGLSEEEIQALNFAEQKPGGQNLLTKKSYSTTTGALNILAALVRRLLSSKPDPEREAMAKLVVDWKPMGWVDHACQGCRPSGEMVIAGFRCGYHIALDSLDRARGK